MEVILVNMHSTLRSFLPFYSSITAPPSPHPFITFLWSLHQVPPRRHISCGSLHFLPVKRRVCANSSLVFFARLFCRVASLSNRRVINSCCAQWLVVYRGRDARPTLEWDIVAASTPGEMTYRVRCMNRCIVTLPSKGRK